MKLTRSQQRLVDDAKQASFTIEIGDTDVDIYKIRLGKVTKGI